VQKTGSISGKRWVTLRRAAGTGTLEGAPIQSMALGELNTLLHS